MRPVRKTRDSGIPRTGSAHEIVVHLVQGRGGCQWHRRDAFICRKCPGTTVIIATGYRRLCTALIACRAHIRWRIFRAGYVPEPHLCSQRDHPQLAEGPSGNIPVLCTPAGSGDFTRDCPLPAGCLRIFLCDFHGPAGWAGDALRLVVKLAAALQLVLTAAAPGRY